MREYSEEFGITVKKLRAEKDAKEAAKKKKTTVKRK
jgi:hypothetical protein